MATGRSTRDAGGDSSTGPSADLAFACAVCWSWRSESRARADVDLAIDGLPRLDWDFSRAILRAQPEGPASCPRGSHRLVMFVRRCSRSRSGSPPASTWKSTRRRTG